MYILLKEIEILEPMGWILKNMVTGIYFFEKREIFYVL